MWGALRTHTQQNIDNFKITVDQYKNSNIPPLLVSSPSIGKCIENKYKYENEYNKFYSFNSKNSDLEILFKLMANNGIVTNGVNGFNIEIEKSTIVIFTVINVTPNPTAPTNNPPTPPFVNINKLKLIYKISQLPEVIKTQLNNNDPFKQKIMTYVKSINDKLLTYTFYMDQRTSFEHILTGGMILL